MLPCLNYCKYCCNLSACILSDYGFYFILFYLFYLFILFLSYFIPQHPLTQSSSPSSCLPTNTGLLLSFGYLKKRHSVFLPWFFSPMGYPHPLYGLLSPAVPSLRSLFKCHFICKIPEHPIKNNTLSSLS